MRILSKYDQVGVQPTGASPTFSTNPSARNLGLFYLSAPYKNEPPPSVNSPGLTNPYMNGILRRQTWDRLDPTLSGSPDFSFLDAAIAADESHSKLSSIEVLAGTSAPAPFYATYPDEVLTLETFGPTTVPWGPNYQTLWETLNIQLAARYDGRLKYVKLISPGHSSESFLVNAGHPADQIAADALAVSLGYVDGVTAWRAGVTWLIDMYARHWLHTPFVLGTGPPFPVTSPTFGNVALQDMFTYGSTTYTSRFGIRADNLASGSPSGADPSIGLIKQISPYCIASGFQFAAPQNGNDPTPPARLGVALQKGIDYKARFMELFAADADDPVSAPVLIEARRQMHVT